MEHAFSPENFQRENRTLFLEFRLFPGTFQWNASKTCVPSTTQPEFPEVNGKRLHSVLTNLVLIVVLVLESNGLTVSTAYY